MNALDALHRAQRAWEATQPQLFFELWPDTGLDETHDAGSGREPSLGSSEHGTVRLVEPVDLHPGGLNAGAEPCWDLLRTDGESFSFPAPQESLLSGVLRVGAPINQTGPGRTSPEDVSGQGQRRSF